MPPKTQTAPPVTQRESPIAIAALVAGTLSLVGLGFLTGLPAIILALIGLKQKAPGRRFLIGGLVTGIVGTLFGFFLILFFFWVVGLDNNRPQVPYPNSHQYMPNQQQFETTSV